MKRNFLLMLLLTLLPFVGWAADGFTFRLVANGADLANPYVVTSEDNVPSSVLIYLNGGPVSDGVWSKQNAETGEWTAIYDCINNPDPNYGDFGKITGVGLYKIDLNGDGRETGTLEIKLGDTHSETPATTSNELKVQPQSTCVMFWGQPFALKVTDIIVEPSVSDVVKGKILAKIKINDLEKLESQAQSLGIKDFSIGLIDALTPEGRQVENGGTTYTIGITGPGKVDIRKGTNILERDWRDGVALADGLVFNGGAQVLAEAADYTFTSYSAATEGSEYAKGKVHVIGSKTVQEIVDERYVSVDYTGIKVLTNENENDANAATFVGKTFYVKGNPNDLPTGRLQLYTYEKKEGEDVFTEVPVWVEVAKTTFTTYAGAYKFFSISAAEYQKKFEDAAVAAAQELKGETPLTEEEIAAAKATAIANMPTPDRYEFGKAKPVLPETWGDDGVLPTGTNAGKYYVWVQAADGGQFYEGGQIAYVGETEIAKAKPTFTGTITVDGVYYVFTGDGNFQGLKKKIEPVLSATLATGVAADAKDVSYYVQRGTKPATKDGDYTWKDLSFDNYTTLEQWSQFTADPEGKEVFRLVARFNGNANYDIIYVGESQVFSNIFEIMKPSVAIQTLVKDEASANYGYGVKPQAKDYDWKVAGWTGYTGNENIKNADIAVSYTWYDANDQKVNPATSDLPVGIYTVVADGPFGTAAGTDFGYVVEPATVYIGETNILAAVEDQTLVFGQELPLKLKYSQGAFTPNTETGAAQIKKFENTMWATGFKAKMIKDANGDAVEDAEEIKLYSVPAYHTYTPAYGPNRVRNDYYTTTILPVGTYTVSADVAYADNKNYKIAAAAGTWTVTAKDIDNNDFGDWQDPYDRYDTPEPRVKGMGGTFKLSKTYTSEEITLYELEEDGEGKVTVKRNELDGKFTYRKGMIAIPGDLTQEEREAEINKQSGFYHGSLVPGRDFEITSYTNNINAGEATFHVKGIGNFKGEKDMTFTIDKAPIFVFPETKKDGNKWTVGSPQEDAFQVDWNGKKEVEVTYKGKPYVKKVPTGINYQLHAFENDRPLVKDMTGEDGFKALKVKFIVGATVGEYEAGLEAYAENDEKAKNYEFVFQTAPLTIEQGTIVLAVANITAEDVNALTYQGTTRPRAKTAAGKFVLADDQVQTLDPAIEQQWWKLCSDKNADAVTWEDNLDEYRQKIKNDVYRYPASDALAEGEAYKVKCTAFPKGTYSSTNYKFVLAEGSEEGLLTVKRAKATIAVKKSPDAETTPANTVVKNYQNFIDAANDWNADSKNKDNQKTAEQMKAEFISQIGDVVNDKNGNPKEFKYPYYTVTGVQPTADTQFDLYQGATVNADNEIIVSAKDNKNYDITLTNGYLVIAPVNDALVLNSDPVVYWTDQYGDYTDGEVTPEFPNGKDLPEGKDPVVKDGGDLAKIKTYDKVPVKTVTIALKPASLKPENEAYAQWKAGEWHTMVLPFATTVGDIAYNFGYAIVNVVDKEATEASTKPNEVHFKLQEIMDEIPANTPFCIKSQFDFDYDEPLVFGVGGLNATGEPILIEFDAKPTVSAGKTFTFEGTYDQMIIDKNTPTYKFLGPDSRWKQFSATSTSQYTMQPYTGYVNLKGLTADETREAIFIFEEEDGSTTAIDAAKVLNGKSAEGLYRVDGIKVQGAPSQKGVYIQNGKKFVK